MKVLYLLVGIGSAGLLFLLSYWMPQLRILLTSRRAKTIDKARFGFVVNFFKETEIVSLNRIQVSSSPVGKEFYSFDYQSIRFVFLESQGMFLGLDCSEVHEELALWNVDPDQGLADREEAQVRAGIFGPNLVDIQEKSSLIILIDEILHPFFVFQMLSIVLWLYEQYYYYSVCIILINIVSIGASLIETKRVCRSCSFLSSYRIQRDCKNLRKVNVKWKS